MVRHSVALNEERVAKSIGVVSLGPFVSGNCSGKFGLPEATGKERIIAPIVKALHTLLLLQVSLWQFSQVGNSNNLALRFFRALFEELQKTTLHTGVDFLKLMCSSRFFSSDVREWFFHFLHRDDRL